MRKIADIHTFEDQGFLQRMTRRSAVVLVAGAAVALGTALVLVAMGGGATAMPVRLDPWIASWTRGELHLGQFAAWLMILGAASVAALPVHEAVHGICFKLFAPPGARVTFGANLRMGMIYACAEGVVFSRRAYAVALMAPSIVVTAVLVAGLSAAGLPVAAVLAGAIHLAGCTGDAGYLEVMLRDRRITKCEDTAWGVCFFGEDDAGEERL